MTAIGARPEFVGAAELPRLRVPAGEERDHQIPLERAAAMTRRYREALGPAAEKPMLFSREIFDEILAQAGCAGVRLYLAHDEAGKLTVVLAGVTEHGDDILDGVIGEDHLVCPPICPGGVVYDGLSLAYDF